MGADVWSIWPGRVSAAPRHSERGGRRFKGRLYTATTDAGCSKTIIIILYFYNRWTRCLFYRCFYELLKIKNTKPRVCRRRPQVVEKCYGRVYYYYT